MMNRSVKVVLHRNTKGKVSVSFFAKGDDLEIKLGTLPKRVTRQVWDTLKTPHLDARDVGFYNALVELEGDKP
jgi:hypothetical protein